MANIQHSLLKTLDNIASAILTGVAFFISLLAVIIAAVGLGLSKIADWLVKRA